MTNISDEGAGVGSGGGGPPGLAGAVIALLSKVTAAFRAKTRP